MSILRVALIQLDVALGQPNLNLHRVAEMITRASAEGATLVVLPELWATGYDLENIACHATHLSEGLWPEIRALAERHHVFIYGSLVELRESRAFNTAALIAPTGQIMATYSKLHLFGLMDETKYLSPGASPVLTDTPWGKTGLSICYDLRFPELYRRYAINGAQVFLICAEWPKRRIEHWRTLLRARAIENQCIVIACNCVGANKGENFGGHSALISAWGETCVEGGETADLILAEVDPNCVTEARERIRVFADRRVDVYGG